MVITIAEHIKQEIAERVVEEATPGYHDQGWYYVVNGQTVMFYERTAPWVPWSSGDEIISVNDLVFEVGGAEADAASFDPSASADIITEHGADEAAKMDYEAAVSFALGYVPDSYDPFAVDRYDSDGASNDDEWHV